MTAPVSPSRSSSRCSPLRDPRQETERLEEAAAIWRDLRSPVGEARVELVLALLIGDTKGARRAEDRLRAMGARGYRSTLARFIPLDDSGSIVVQSLGRFRVFRAGDPIPAHGLAVPQGA